MRRHPVLGALVVLWVPVFLTACSPPQPPLRVATIPWIGYQPLFLAEDLGHYPPQLIRLVEFGSNRESLRALRNGDVEAAALTLDEALLLAAEGHDIAVILVLDCSAGADALVVRPGVGTLSQLAGRRVGVESNANGAYVLSRALHLADLSPAAIHIVPLGIGSQIEAYRAGEVDALVTYEPVRTQLAALGAETLFDSREIPCEIVDVLAAHRRVLRERRRQIAGLIRGWFLALDYQAAAPAEAAARLGPPLDLEPADYLAAIAGVELGTPVVNCRTLNATPETPGLRASARALTRVMKANGLLPAGPDLAGLVEPGPANALSCRTAPSRP